MKSIVRILMIITVFLVGFNSALACQIPTSVSKSIQAHNIIFSGKVEGCFSEGDQSYLKFSLDRMWKGKGEKQFTYLSSCPSSFFKTSRYYLVYANYIGDSEYINISYGLTNCTRTTEIISWWKAMLKNLQSKFDGIPVSIDHRINDFKELGEPAYTFALYNFPIVSKSLGYKISLGFVVTAKYYELIFEKQG